MFSGFYISVFLGAALGEKNAKKDNSRLAKHMMGFK